MEKLICLVASGRNVSKSKSLLSVEEKKLLQGQGEEMWEFVHNILQMKRLAEESTSLETSHACLELQSLKSAIELLESDIKQLEKMIGNLVESTDALCYDIKLIELKKELFKLQSLQSQEYGNVLNEYTRRLKERTKLIISHQKEETFICSHGSTLQDYSNMESVFIKQLKESFEQVVKLLRMLSEGSCSNADLEKAKLNTWTKIESVVQSLPTEAIYSSLIQLTEIAMKEVVQLSHQVNSQNEMQDLRYVLNDGVLQDKTNCSSILQSVEEHIQEAQLSHVCMAQKCSMMEKTANESYCQFQIAFKLWADAVDEFCLLDSEKRQLYDRLVLLQCECAGYEASMHALNSVSKRLSETQNQMEIDWRRLQEKINKIKEFDVIVHSKENDIQSLAKHNLSARQRICHQQTELSVYMLKNICSHKPDVISSLTNLVDFVSHETHSLLALTKLNLFTPLELKHWREKSTLQAPCVGIIMKLPYQVPVYSILQNMLLCLQRVAQVESNVSIREACMKEEHTFDVNGKNDIAATVTRSQECMAQHEQALSLSLSSASKAFADLSDVQTIISDWWNQPGGSTVTWKTVEGMNIVQWLEQWHLLVARQSQLMSHT